MIIITDTDHGGSKRDFAQDLGNGGQANEVYAGILYQRSRCLCVCMARCDEIFVKKYASPEVRCQKVDVRSDKS